jgi:hypothetical protein
MVDGNMINATLSFAMDGALQIMTLQLMAL